MDCKNMQGMNNIKYTDTFKFLLKSQSSVDFTFVAAHNSSVSRQVLY
jgi:hypothetical protein